MDSGFEEGTGANAPEGGGARADAAARHSTPRASDTPLARFPPGPGRSEGVISIPVIASPPYENHPLNETRDQNSLVSRDLAAVVPRERRRHGHSR